MPASGSSGSNNADRLQPVSHQPVGAGHWFRTDQSGRNVANATHGEALFVSLINEGVCCLSQLHEALSISLDGNEDTAESEHPGAKV